MTSDLKLQLTTARTNATTVFEVVKPLPKAPPKLQTCTKRRIRKTAILIDMPAKNASAEERPKKKTKK